MNGLQVMPDLSPAEYESLKASIAEQGVIVPLTFDERGGHYHLHKEEWFCVVEGRMALDFFARSGEYVLTQLLEAEHPRFVHVPPPYYHVVRNVGPGEVKFLIVANEAFDPENPDTHALPVSL